MSAEHQRERMLAEVVAGLSAARKSLPCKYFYDARGSALFERITQLDVYYPTRTEIAILTDNAGEIAREVGPGALVLEPGTGAGVKTQMLLAMLDTPAVYVPVDIDGETLLRTGEALARAFPGLHIVPLVADYTQPLQLPELPSDVRVERSLIFYPGSTIGNFEPDAAGRFLANMTQRLPEPVMVLIGVDLHKDVAVLEAAYNDPQGITAEFNRNVLHHLNRELGADFDADAFAHVAFYNRELQRIEMHLESQRDQVVRLDGRTVRIAAGERIHTESSYKYTLAGFQALAGAAGLQHRRSWTDADERFSVQLFQASGSAGLATDPPSHEQR